MVRAKAENVNGISTASVPNSSGATIRTVPSTMNVPVKDPTSTQSMIVLTWSPITNPVDTGNSAIISYNL